MKKHVSYQTEGVCSTQIEFDIEDGKVYNINFMKGCPGSLQGVSKLAEGRDAREIVELCKGILCREKNSCPNQLAIAIEENM